MVKGVVENPWVAVPGTIDPKFIVFDHAICNSRTGILQGDLATPALTPVIVINKNEMIIVVTVIDPAVIKPAGGIRGSREQKTSPIADRGACLRAILVGVERVSEIVIPGRSKYDHAVRSANGNQFPLYDKLPVNIIGACRIIGFDDYSFVDRQRLSLRYGYVVEHQVGDVGNRSKVPDRKHGISGHGASQQTDCIVGVVGKRKGIVR